MAELPGPAETGTRLPFAVDEATLSPVFLDFAADPHFLVLGDTETGKSNLLHLIADGIVTRYSLDQARLIIVDYRRSLLDAADTEHRIGYAPSSAAAGTLLNDAREALVTRLPPADLTADQLRNRSWWRGSDLFVIVDDYDLVAGATNPLLPLVDLLPQAREIGLHLVLARSAGGAGRAMFEPVIQRLREMGSTALLMSASKDEGPIFGVKPQTLPPAVATSPPAAPTRCSSKPPSPLLPRPQAGASPGGQAGQGPGPGSVAAGQDPSCHTTGPAAHGWRVICGVGDVVRPVTGGAGGVADGGGCGGGCRAAWPGSVGDGTSAGGWPAAGGWWGSGKWFRGDGWFRQWKLTGRGEQLAVADGGQYVGGELAG